MTEKQAEVSVGDTRTEQETSKDEAGAEADHDQGQIMQNIVTHVFEHTPISAVAGHGPVRSVFQKGRGGQ